MPHTDLVMPDIAQVSQGWLGTPDEAPGGGMLVWRVRVWLLALALGLIAANSHDKAALLAPREAAKQAECSVAASRPARARAGTAPAPLPKDCASRGVPFGPGDL